MSRAFLLMRGSFVSWAYRMLANWLVLHTLGSAKVMKEASGSDLDGECVISDVHVGGFAVGADAGPSGGVHEIGVAGAGELQPDGHHFVGEAMVERLEGGAGAVRASEDVGEFGAVEHAQSCAAA